MLYTAIVTLFLTIFLQSIVDPSLFVPAEWEVDTWMNVLQFWLIFFSVYLLFEFLVDWGSQKVLPLTPKKSVLIVLGAQITVFLWVVLADVVFYKLYYKVESLNETTFYSFDIPLTIAVLTIGSIYFYQRISRAKAIEDQEREPVKIAAYSGNENRFIDTSEMGVFFVADGITWIGLKNGRTMHTDQSLGKISEELPSPEFFRINRQVIVSKSIVKGFEKLEYQKLKVQLSPEVDCDANMVVSKYTAPEFKRWLTNSPQN